MELKEQDWKLLYELSMNSKARKKDLSGRLKISPQLIGYKIEKMHDDSILRDEVVIDPAKFGLVRIVVVLVFVSFDRSEKADVIRHLKETDEIVRVESLGLGADLLVEYAVQNLSYFNKLHSTFLEKFSRVVEVISISPILVQHIFSRKYLYKKAKLEDSAIIGGDRAPISFRPIEKKLIESMMKNPSDRLLSLSRSLKVDARTVSKIIKGLESKKVIRGYTISLDYDSLGISVCNLVVRYKFLMPKDSRKIMGFVAGIPEVTSVMKLMGNDTLLIRIESRDDYRKIVMDIRKELMFYDYKVYDGGNVLKNTYIPKGILS